MQHRPKNYSSGPAMAASEHDRARAIRTVAEAYLRLNTAMPPLVMDIASAVTKASKFLHANHDGVSYDDLSAAECEALLTLAAEYVQARS